MTFGNAKPVNQIATVKQMSKRRKPSPFSSTNTETLQAIIDVAAEMHDRATYALMIENARLRQNAHTRERVEWLRSIPERVGLRIAAGDSTDAAIRAVATALDEMDAAAANSDLSIACVTLHWRRACRASQSSGRELRDGRIWQLAATGCTNDEIGRAMGLHVTTVSRIISKMKRKRVTAGMHRP